MADGYEVTLKEYEEALRNFLKIMLEQLEPIREQGESWAARAWGGINPFVSTQRERLEKELEDTFNKYMEEAESLTVKGKVPNTLTDFEEILSIGSPALYRTIREPTMEEQSEIYDNQINLMSGLIQRYYPEYTTEEANQLATSNILGIKAKESGATRVVSEGGYDFLVDDEGNKVQTLGRTDKGVSSWDIQQQLWDVEDRRRALELAQEQELTKRAEAFWGDGAGRMQMLGGNYQAPMEQAQLEYNQWEQVRNDILESIGNEPESEVKRFFVENQRNPFAQQLESTQAYLQDPQTKIDYINATKKALQSELKMIESQADDRNDPFYMTPEITTYANQLKRQIGQLDVQVAQAEAQSKGVNIFPQLAEQYTQGNLDLRRFTPTTRSSIIGAVEMAMANARPQAQPPAEIATPEWLKPLMVTPTASIPQTGASKLRPMSGYVWNRLSPSQRGFWSGYAEHAGQSAENLLGISEAMLPQSLSLGRTWKSFVQ